MNGLNGQTSFTRMRIVEQRPPHWAKTKTFAAGLLVGALFACAVDAVLYGSHITIEVRCAK